MNYITFGIENAHSYLFEAIQQESQEGVTQDESLWTFSQTIAVSFGVALVAVFALRLLSKTVHQWHHDTPELFWKELESNQRPPLPIGPVEVMGNVLAEDLSSLQKQMFSVCNGLSQIFVEYVQERGLKPNQVIDLGCGIGANSYPLLKYGVNVIAIDRMECLLDKYRSRMNEQERPYATLQCADLTTLENYGSENNAADVVLAVDVLPYLPISSWRSTMEKIFVSLKPGGYFFGTVFVKKAFFNHPVVIVHERFGAHYYNVRDLAVRLIRHSGLEMVECRLRENGYGCYEFVARKPC